MQLTPLTKDILGNFSTINTGIVIEGGAILKTVSPGRHILAHATIDTTFPKKIAIHDLKQLLNVIDLFDQPDIDFQDKFLTIKDKASSSRYLYSPEKHVQGYHPEKGYPGCKLPDDTIKFELTDENLAAILKAGQVLQMPHIAVVGANGVQKLVVFNSASSTSDTYERIVGTTTHTFRMIYTREYLRFLPRPYQVTIAKNGLAEFKAPDVTYYIAAESNSNFEE